MESDDNNNQIDENTIMDRATDADQDNTEVFEAISNEENNVQAEHENIEEMDTTTDNSQTENNIVDKETNASIGHSYNLRSARTRDY